jgi:hypothetical protein
VPRLPNQCKFQSASGWMMNLAPRYSQYREIPPTIKAKTAGMLDMANAHHALADSFFLMTAKSEYRGVTGTKINTQIEPTVF